MIRFASLCTALCFLLCTQALSQSCCVKNNADFHALAMNTDFMAAHLSPLPLNYSPEHGSMIKFETLDGKDGQAFYVPSDQHTSNVLLIFHEWWGLNDYIKREAERWQEMLGNVDVYAVDLFDGQVATNPTEAGRISSSLDKKRAETIIKGVLVKAGMDKRIATLGWCMGGSWSFTAAVLAGEQSAATVMYYGFPETKPKRLMAVKSDVLYIRGTRDKFISAAAVKTFGEQVEATGHKFTLYTFDADHAFANPSNPVYDRNASKEAEKLTLNFLKEKLQLE